MPEVTVPFHASDAARVIGKRVQLVAPYGGWPAGKTGRVVQKHPFFSGYVVEVQWNGAYTDWPPVFEYFGVIEFESYLAEC